MHYYCQFLSILKKIANFLDVNLHNREHKPYSKPNNSINYVHRESSYSPQKIYNILKFINISITLNEEVLRPVVVGVVVAMVLPMVVAVVVAVPVAIAADVLVVVVVALTSSVVVTVDREYRSILYYCFFYSHYIYGLIQSVYVVSRIL